jgi:hypothetical protein
LSGIEKGLAKENTAAKRGWFSFSQPAPERGRLAQSTRQRAIFAGKKLKEWLGFSICRIQHVISVMSKFKSIQRRFFKYFPNYRISISYRKTSEGVAFRNKYMSSRQRWLIEMNIFSAFDTGVMVALLLGIEFLRSDIQTILYCKRNDPGIFKSCLYTLFILLASLYSIVAGAMLNPEPVPVYELMPGFQIGVYGSCFLFIFLVIAGLYRKILPLVLLGYAMVYVIGVLIPLLGYVVSMMNYFASVGWLWRSKMFSRENG